MKPLLINKETLPLNDPISSLGPGFLRIKGPTITFNVMTVRTVEEVDKAAAGGCETFVKEFFGAKPHSYAMPLKSGIGREQTIAIIYKLFEWKIPSYPAEYNGQLTIDPAAKCPEGSH